MSSHPRHITRALLSVSDKAGLVAFATELTRHGVELISTGGTAKALTDAGLAVTDVAELTGSPEMMDGRVKTLHPKVHGGLSRIRTNKEHVAAMEKHRIEPIDLLVVNLYPFEATVAKDASFEDCIENIDIGGPAMIRAAAKNHMDVTVVVEPADYEKVLGEMAKNGGRCSFYFDKAWRRKRTHALRPMTPQFRTGSRTRCMPTPPTIALSAGNWRRPCAMAKTRIRAQRSIVRPANATGSPPQGSCRESSSPTTTLTTPMPPTNALRNLIRAAPPPA